jgi:hypothetical protein
MAWRGKRNYTVIVGDCSSVRMCRRMELGFPERSVVTAVSSSSPVSIFMISVPLVYAMCGRNSVVHLKWIQQRRHPTNPRRVTTIVVLRTVQEYRSVVLEHLVAMVTVIIWSSADDSHCGCRKGFVCFYSLYLPLAQTVWSGTIGSLLRNELTETWKAVMVVWCEVSSQPLLRETEEDK